MAEKIKKHKEDIILIAVIGIVLGLVGVFVLPEMMGTPEYSALAADTSTPVAVTATVQSWITLSVSTSSTVLGDMVDLSGTAHIASSSFTATVGTNGAGGYVLAIGGANGALATGSEYIFTSTTTASSTITAGTDMYGAMATSTETGGAPTIQGAYDAWTAQDWVGAIASTSAPNIAVYNTGPVTGSITTLKIAATCDTLQSADSYTDTITFTATSQ